MPSSTGHGGKEWQNVAKCSDKLISCIGVNDFLDFFCPKWSNGGLLMS